MFYLFSYERRQSTTWNSARETCRQFDPDADLVAVDSHGKQHFLNCKYVAVVCRKFVVVDGQNEQMDRMNTLTTVLTSCLL